MVETIFELPDTPGGRAARAAVEAAGVEVGPEGELIVRRRVSASGRSRIYLNGALSTAATLAGGGERIVNIHGQHAHQSLLRPALHLSLLDDFAGLSAERGALAALAGELRAAERALEAHRGGVREQAQRADLLRFQVEELERAAPRAGEMEAIEEELPRLQNAGRLAALSASLFETLYEGEGSVIEQLGRSMREIERLAELDPAQANLAGEAASALAQVESLAGSLRAYAQEDRAGPRPPRRAGSAARPAPRAAAQVRRGRGRMPRAPRARPGRAERPLRRGGDRGPASPGRWSASGRRRPRRALSLSAARKKAAKKLDKGMRAGLAELGLKGAAFETRLESRADEGGFVRAGGRAVTLRAEGIDQCAFFFSPNAGEAARPLARVASGGELSRLMLVLEAELRRGDLIPTLVFDEVDAGIAGAVAEVVGRKLREVSRNHQVLVITHLPQVASLGDRHFRIEKRTAKGRTTALIHPVEGEARVEEIARMGAGVKVTEAARRHAREMLQGARRG